ncbi:hypothetical protein BKA62DRAFT_676420 [Auriculariales sp. MPI-PUGE-AT-0066]|nr:hypothetical protein BKA62DRAFT_676420 [Auriculariales sp. MPI-PUGE-AT-0066]
MQGHAWVSTTRSMRQAGLGGPPGVYHPDCQRDAADAVDALALRRPPTPRDSVTCIRGTGVEARLSVYDPVDATRRTRWTQIVFKQPRAANAGSSVLALLPSRAAVYLVSLLPLHRVRLRRCLRRRHAASLASATCNALIAAVAPRQPQRMHATTRGGQGGIWEGEEEAVACEAEKEAGACKGKEEAGACEGEEEAVECEGEEEAVECEGTRRLPPRPRTRRLPPRPR